MLRHYKKRGVRPVVVILREEPCGSEPRDPLAGLCSNFALIVASRLSRILPQEIPSKRPFGLLGQATCRIISRNYPECAAAAVFFGSRRRMAGSAGPAAK
jgi:hypothetical protein